MTLAETLAAAETKVRHNMYSDSDPDKSFFILFTVFVRRLVSGGCVGLTAYKHSKNTIIK